MRQLTRFRFFKMTSHARTSLFVSSLFLFQLCNVGFADIVIVPDDLPVGSEYRLLFITSKHTNPDSSDIAFYNSFVNDIANNLNGQTGSSITGLGEWRAIASTQSISARDNTQTNPINDGPGVPIYSVNGRRLANDYSDFWDGTLLNDTGGESGTENGSAPPVVNIGSVDLQLVFTGTASDGTNTGNTPLGTTGFGKVYGVGELISGNGFADSWVAAGSSGTPAGSIYGISPILTVAIPEPNSLYMVSIVAAIWLRRRVRSPY